MSTHTVQSSDTASLLARLASTFLSPAVACVQGGGSLRRTSDRITRSSGGGGTRSERTSVWMGAAELTMAWCVRADTALRKSIHTSATSPRGGPSGGPPLSSPRAAALTSPRDEETILRLKVQVSQLQGFTQQLLQGTTFMLRFEWSRGLGKGRGETELLS